MSAQAKLGQVKVMLGFSDCRKLLLISRRKNQVLRSQDVQVVRQIIVKYCQEQIPAKLMESDQDKCCGKAGNAALLYGLNI